MMNVSYVYLVTLDIGDSYQLVGAFLSPLDAERAKQQLMLQGIDPEVIDIDHAPLGIINLRGIDSPYNEGPIH